MDNDRYMQALRQRSAVMPYGMPVSSDPEASDAYGEGVVRGVAKNLRARAGDFINALRAKGNDEISVLEAGNIDLGNRPLVRNPDGSISTVRSIGVNFDGREVLIPTVVNGRVVSDEEAIKEYLKTNQHLGIFPTVKDAQRFAEYLHEAEAARLSK